MSSKKWILTVLLILLLAITVWYLFIKDYNYRISFKTTQSPGALYSSLIQWQGTRPNNSDSIYLISKRPFNAVSHQIETADSLFSFEWEINRINDSESKVIVYARDLNNSLKQNISVPFTKNAFVKRSINEVKLFMEYVKVLEERFEVTVEPDIIESVPSVYYAYLPLKSKISEKAGLMAGNIGIIMGYIRTYDIELTGDPFIIVNNIDTENDIIDYEFCFPIKKSTTYPESEFVRFKDRESFSAIKANFKGNYRSTEFAWFELMDYAKRNGLEIENKALEIYRNDPQSGTDSKDWLAEIYVPLK